MRRFFPLTMTSVVALALSASAAPVHHATPHRSTSAAPASAIRNVFWQPNDLTQGSPAFFTVEFERPPLRVSATFAGKTLAFFKSAEPTRWNALAGVDLETQPGSYDLHVTAVLPGGHTATTVKSIDVKPGDFRTGSVDVPENFVEPNPEEQRRIAGDNTLKTRAYAHAGATPEWSGNFVRPVEGHSTESFGESRILNEEKSSLHRGTDFPVPEGTPVLASNSGTVVLATEMFYEGQCVLVDHGQKFFTIYMHLSKTDVQTGDHLKKGARIGLSGATGRVSGPHMHFGIRWNGAYLDPVKLLALTLPANPEAKPAPTPRASHHARR